MQTKDIYTRSTAFKSSEARCGFQTRIYEALEHATRAQQQQHTSNKYKPTETNIFTDRGCSGGATVCKPQTITKQCAQPFDQYPTYTESEKTLLAMASIRAMQNRKLTGWCSSGQRQPLVIHHHRESPLTSVACLTHKYNRTSIIAHKFYQCVPCPIVFSRFMKAVEGVSHLGRRLWVCLYPWLPPKLILLISCIDLSFDWQLQLSIAYVARTRQRTNKHSNYSCINRSRDMALHTCFSQRVPHCCEKTPPRSPPPTNGIRWKPEQRF
jgi:hypothetical protein